MTSPEAVLQERLNGLKGANYEELVRLPEHTTEEIRINQSKYAVSIWKDHRADGSLQLVVQVYRPRFVGIGPLLAEGFRITPEGRISILPEPELCDYR